MTDPEPLIDVDEAARRLSMEPRAVRALIRAGKLPVAIRGRGRTRLDWTFIGAHLAGGGELTTRWWETRE